MAAGFARFEDEETPPPPMSQMDHAPTVELESYNDVGSSGNDDQPSKYTQTQLGIAKDLTKLALPVRARVHWGMQRLLRKMTGAHDVPTATGRHGAHSCAGAAHTRAR